MAKGLIYHTLATAILYERNLLEVVFDDAVLFFHLLLNLFPILRFRQHLVEFTKSHGHIIQFLLHLLALVVKVFQHLVDVFLFKQLLYSVKPFLTARYILHAWLAEHFDKHLSLLAPFHLNESVWRGAKSEHLFRANLAYRLLEVASCLHLVVHLVCIGVRHAAIPASALFEYSGQLHAFGNSLATALGKYHIAYYKRNLHRMLHVGNLIAVLVLGLHTKLGVSCLVCAKQHPTDSVSNRRLAHAVASFHNVHEVSKLVFGIPHSLKVPQAQRVDFYVFHIFIVLNPSNRLSLRSAS